MAKKNIYEAKTQRLSSNRVKRTNKNNIYTDDEIKQDYIFKYGYVKKQPVYIMKKVKSKNGLVAVQSLRTGDIASVKKSEIKNISTKYPEYK